MSARQSSTQIIPQVRDIPRHVAIIMDGNGRWAKQRFLPRVAGHKSGAQAVRKTVRACAARGVESLTLFAFSSENWRRPKDEVRHLMQLLLQALQQEVDKLHENNIRLRFIGERSAFDPQLVDLMAAAEKKTQLNQILTLNIAVNYGGRWDILQAVNRLTQARPERAGHYTESDIAPYLSLNDMPEPDLFIRTGGEQRVSNFLLWQLAYTELYFTDTLWPDFDAASLDAAILSYQQRERRFGRTSEQLHLEAPRRGVAGA
ncbi:MAG: isoprenyl transferase [Betaproteobacteria bacterium]|nr:isoprenyl transferase [Betaproteobacteria bacterium]